MSSSDLLDYERTAQFRPDFPSAGFREFEAALPVSSTEPASKAGGADPESLSAVLDHGEEEIEARIREELRLENEKRLSDLQEQTRSRLENLEQELARAQAEHRTELTLAAAELAFAVAERVVRRELTTDREAVRRTLADALLAVEDARSLRLRVHPDDAATVRQEQEHLRSLRIEEVVADASVSVGGCVLEAGDRTWDATVGGQLEQLHEALREALESPS